MTLDLDNDSVVTIVLLFFLLLRLCATGANFRLDVPLKVVARITGGENLCRSQLQPRHHLGSLQFVLEPSARSWNCPRLLMRCYKIFMSDCLLT